jgi:hypothetical protein
MSEDRKPYIVNSPCPKWPDSETELAPLSTLDEAIAIADDKSMMMPTRAHLKAVVDELRRLVKL